MADPKSNSGEKKPEPKELTPIEQLERDHLQATLKLQNEIDALDKDLREADAMVREIRGKLMQKRREKLNASYAFDAQRVELEARKAAA